jgi:hypothetical protein
MLFFRSGPVSDFEEVGCAGDIGDGDAVGGESEDTRE